MTREQRLPIEKSKRGAAGLARGKYTRPHGKKPKAYDRTKERRTNRRIEDACS